MTVMNSSPHELHRSQEGVISILVTLVLMIVISLVVLGFAQVARRTQSQQLNQQLTTQAFYAAETAVNDVINLIVNSNPAPTVAQMNKPTCNNLGGGNFYSALPSPTISSPGAVSYTCVTVDPSPNVLQYDVGTTSSVVPLTASSGTINTVSLLWKAQGTNPWVNCPTTATSIFSSWNTWTSGNCGYGVLRIDLVPTAAANLDAPTLEKNTLTSFLVPDTHGANPATLHYQNPVGTLNSGDNVLGVKCTNANCSVTIDRLGQSQYYLRVSSIYRPATLQVSASGPGGPVGLSGAQIVIDATGKAQGQLRRIQENIPLASQNQLSDFAIETYDSVCKRFAVMGGSGSGYYNNSIPAGLTGNSKLCQ